MRSLLITRNLPRADGGGADLRAGMIVSALAQLGETAVFGLYAEDVPPLPPAEVEVWRTSTVSGLTAATAASPGALGWLRRADGHPADGWFSPAAGAELSELAASFRPDVAIIDHLWLHRYIGVARAWRVPVILNTHNVEAELQSGIAESHRGTLPRLLAERTRVIESAAVRAVDQLWACSGADAIAFARLYPGAAPAAVVPNAVGVDTYSAAEGDAVVFPGVLSYPPNATAALFLVEQVLPLLDDTTLLIVGREPPGALLEAAARSGRVDVAGSVDDVRPYLAAAGAMAVPLFAGGGTRFKLLEAFASRLPVVTSRKGVEGIDAEDGVHVLLAETAEDFATQLRRLRTDEALRRRLVGNAHALVRRRYSAEAAADAVGIALSSCAASRNSTASPAGGPIS